MTCVIFDVCETV